MQRLLASGGDHRLEVGEEGLSPYRVSLAPTDAVPFGSCTATSPGPRALAGARALHEALAGGLGAEAAAAELRQRLRAVLEAPDSAAIALTPSGTDVLYLVNHLLRRRFSRVHHIVVGASELGGGTLRASEGRTFSARSPHGPPDTPDRPIDGLNGCSASPIYLRTAAGEQVPPEEVDAAVVAAVEAASRDGTGVVVHLVAHSKTGLRAPSMRACEHVQERFRAIILVDAAQGRLAPADVRRALQTGFLVLFTGSKFYSGPPFSGALLLPPEWAGDPGPLSTDLGAWFDRASLPDRWGEARGSLATESNPGLHLRWAAALAEMEAYHAIPAHWRGRVYATFAGAVHETFGPGDDVALEFPVPPVHELTTALGAFPTVFGFKVRRGDGWADTAALKRLHAELDSPHPTYARQHLGQPVALGPPGADATALLRIALGARLVTDFAYTPDAGGSWMRARMGEIRARIAEILKG